MDKLLLFKMSFLISVHFLFLVKFKNPHFIIFLSCLTYSYYCLNSSFFFFKSFTPLEAAQSVIKISAHAFSLATNIDDSTVGHKVLSHG